MKHILQFVLPFVLVAAALAADDPSDLLAQGRVDEATSALENKIKNSPNDAAAQNLLCRAYYAVGNWDRSVAACEKAVALESNNSMYHLWLGRAYGQKADNASIFSAPGLAKKARVEFEAAVNLDSKNVEARSDLSEFYFEAPGMVGGGKDKAELQAQALEKLSPAKAHWVRAHIAEKNKDFDVAEKEYRAAIEASHDNSAAWLDLASFYRRRNRYDDMEKAINHAVSGKADPPEVLVDAADSLLRSGRNFSLAAQLLRRYLSSSTKVEEAPAFKAHYLLGSLLEKQGDKKNAAQEYSASLALARNYSRAQEALNRVNR